MSALLDLVRQRKAELLAAAEKPQAELRPEAEGDAVDSANAGTGEKNNNENNGHQIAVSANAEPDFPAEEIQARPADAVSAKPVDPLFDFSDEAAAIAELQRRLVGLPAAEGFALVDQWERRQRASIWEKIGYKPPRSDGFHGPLRYREISVA